MISPCQSVHADPGVSAYAVCTERSVSVSLVTQAVCSKCCHAQTVLQDCDKQPSPKEPPPFGIVSQGWDPQFVTALAFLSQDHSRGLHAQPSCLLCCSLSQ